MTNFRFLENDFTGGQVSPLLRRRSNVQRHQTGVKTLQNMTLFVQGGITSRPGSLFVSEVKDSSANTVLIDFQFSTTEAYIIEMGDQYFRFYKESGQILESDITITGITQANPGVVTTSGAHGLTTGDQVYITEIVGMTELNHDKIFYTVGTTTSTTFEIQDRDGTNIDTTSYTAYSSGGVVNKIYTITSPYAATDIDKIYFTQSADTLTLVHEDYEPRELTRTSDTNWTLTITTLIDGPYLTQNSTTTTISISGTGASSITLTASATTGINDDQGFLTTDVDRFIRWNDGSTWHYYKVTSRSSSTVVIADRISDATPGATTATRFWRLGAFSETTGYPRTVTYHQQRRFYGGTPVNPDSVWGSAIDDFVNFTPGVEDSDAVNYVLASNKVNAIYWLTSATRLRIGTEGGVFTLWGGSDNSAITPTNVSVDQENHIRCKQLRPIDVGKVTLFAQRSGKILRELAYNFETGGLLAPDITIASENILGDVGDTSDLGVLQMALQLEPLPIIWCVKDNGDFAGLTYSRETQTVGWHNHTMGGTDALVKSVATMPGSGQDRTWVIVERTINSVTRKYIELLTTQFRNKTNKQAYFSDSNIIFTGTKPASTLTPGATTGTGVTFTAGSSVFVSGDVDRIIQSGTARAKITGYTSGTQVTANILRDFPSTSAIAANNWTLSNTTYNNLDHLEGESLSILADGGTHPSQTVTNGSITLANEYTDVTVGLGYTQEVELLDIDLGSASGTAYGGRSKINEVVINFYESIGGFIGFDSNSLTEMIFRSGTDIMNEGVPLFSGPKEVRPKGGWRNGIKTLIRQVDPLPMTVLSIVIKGEVDDATG